MMSEGNKTPKSAAALLVSSLTARSFERPDGQSPAKAPEGFQFLLLCAEMYAMHQAIFLFSYQKP